VSGKRELAADRWHGEVPGARWFRADLHIHTLDDAPTHRVRWASAPSKGESADDLQRRYARALLHAAAVRKIEVLGLTPHAIRDSGTKRGTAWRIVEVWRTETDDDGVPFRDKIYAVFPGFEPSLSDGSRGVHLLLLFDPTIGAERYERAFNGIMGGAQPWDQSGLKNSGLDCKGVFALLDRLKRDEGEDWDFVALAPHAFSNDKGLFGAVKSQMLQDFPTERLSGLELGDETLGQEELDQPGREWLGRAMRKLRLAFYHASDAYVIGQTVDSHALFEVGSRFTLVKMAAPTIESLRQAFLANDSRLRIAFEKRDGHLVLRSDLPEPLGMSRPWLRSISVTGGTSFFGGVTAGVSRDVEFRFSPDLTCIIGGPMSGKSTLLDGVRCHFGHPLPTEADLRRDVEERANARFLSGGADVTQDICGPVSPAEAANMRWPARFFTQRELQAIARDQDGLRRLIYSLSAGGASALAARDDALGALDDRLASLARASADIRADSAEAQQSFDTASRSKEALDRLAATNTNDLDEANRKKGLVQALLVDITQAARPVATAISKVRALASNEGLSAAQELLPPTASLSSLVDKAQKSLESANDSLNEIRKTATSAEQVSAENAETTRKAIQEQLVASGGSAEDLNRFAALEKAAAQYELARVTRDNKQHELSTLIDEFVAAEAQRSELIRLQRADMERLAEETTKRFGSEIRIRVIEHGVLDSIANWMRELKERGITRWWNDNFDGAEASLPPVAILEALERGHLDQLGMSDQVAETFRGAMTEQRRLELHSLRAPDKYVLELKVSADYRQLSELSGGRQLSLLLTLLLEGSDDAPLVIDQPEDEIDRTYLATAVLPAIRKLKGRRQIILATHDADIVVNGDADQVIQLEADATHGWVAVAGAIETPEVRSAIIATLDGGEDAFSLRSRKYGF
jgi:hypothetical protein